MALHASGLVRRPDNRHRMPRPSGAAGAPNLIAPRCLLPAQQGRGSGQYAVQLLDPEAAGGVVSFLPSLLERRRRVDQALFTVVMEAYLHGVSTRKVDDLVKALGIDSGISKSEVSRICVDLDVEVAAFRTARSAAPATRMCSSTPPTARPG
jgi:hypothetical protein